MSNGSFYHSRSFKTLTEQQREAERLRTLGFSPWLFCDESGYRVSWRVAIDDGEAYVECQLQNAPATPKRPGAGNRRLSPDASQG